MANEQHPLINYTKEAFTLPVNLAFLTFLVVTILGITVVSGTLGLPVLIAAALGGALETAFLAFMPENPRFVRAVNARFRAELTRLDRQFQSYKNLQQLGKDYLDKYMDFYRKKQFVTENLIKNQDKTGSLDYSYIEKLHSLESYYVELLHGLEQYEKYVTSGSKQKLESEVAKIKAEMSDAGEKVRTQYQRRVEVLKKRLDKFAAATENMQIARIQVDTLEDTIDFIAEQSLTLKNPDEIGRAIDSIISAAEEHHTTLEELDRVLSEMLPLTNDRRESSDENEGFYPQNQNPIYSR